MSEPGAEAALPPPPPRGHPLARSVLFTITFLGIYIGSTLVVYLTAWGLKVPGVSQGLDLRTEILLFVFALNAVLLYPVTLFFLRVFDRRDFASLGFRLPVGGRRRALREAVVVPLATVAFLGLWILAVHALGSFEILGASRERLAGIPGWGRVEPALMLPLLLLGFLIQGGVEEWVARGYILRALRERYGFLVSASFSSLVFASLHAANPDASVLAIVNTFLAGFLLAELVERSGSLWSAVLCHGVWNFAMGCVASLPVSGATVFKLFEVRLTGPVLVTGGGYGPEGSLLTTVLVLPLIGLLWPRRPSPFQV